MYVKSITFSDGTAVPLRPGSLTVICGPNNAGKSAALRDIASLIKDRATSGVVADLDLHFKYNEADVVRLLEEQAPHVFEERGTTRYAGIGYELFDASISLALSSAKKRGLASVAPVFVSHLDTASRIMGADAPRSIDLLHDAPSHPIHVLQRTPSALDTISGYFSKAFGEGLQIYWGAGKSVPLQVGPQVELEPGEHLLSISYLERLEQLTHSLEFQGDGMRSFATVMLGATALGLTKITLIDEPEAFLHPPQARMLGEFLARERPRDNQLFIATHSIDIVQGVLRAIDPDVQILRIERDGGVNRVHELDSELASEIATEPMTKYSNILNGIFHRRVIVCESDADSAFYNAIADVVDPVTTADTLFTHGNGKSSLPKIAKALTSLRIPVSVIADIDLLNDEKSFRSLVVNLGGDWSSFDPAFSRFKKAVENRQAFLKVTDVKEAVAQALLSLRDKDPLTFEAKKKIVDAVAQTSPWESLKTAGRAGIPAGQMIADFELLLAEASKLGLWIVPIGELESFCKTALGGHGPTWLRNVLENFDLATAPELSAARDFLAGVLRVS